MDISTAISAIANVLGLFQKDSYHDDDLNRHFEEKRQEALQAMYTALIATRQYQEAQPKGVDRSKQFELSNLWATAAIKSKSFVAEAMPMNLAKARYWLDRIKASDEQVKAEGIDLDTVEMRIRELIEQS